MYTDSKCVFLETLRFDDVRPPRLVSECRVEYLSFSPAPDPAFAQRPHGMETVLECQVFIQMPRDCKTVILPFTSALLRVDICPQELLQ